MEMCKEVNMDFCRGAVTPSKHPSLMPVVEFNKPERWKLMKGKHGTADAGLRGGGCWGMEAENGWVRKGGRWTVSRGGIQTMLGVVWCGPVTPQDITAVNRRRWNKSAFAECAVLVCICCLVCVCVCGGDMKWMFSVSHNFSRKEALILKIQVSEYSCSNLQNLDTWELLFTERTGQRTGGRGWAGKAVTFAKKLIFLCVLEEKVKKKAGSVSPVQKTPWESSSG